MAMQLGVITLFPEMFAAVTEYGISGRAFRDELMALSLYNPRDFTLDKHRTVDDKPFGGGPGMLMKTEPLVAAIKASKQQLPEAPVMYLSPQGRTLDNAAMQELARRPQAILVCGRYQGIDQRVIDAEIDEEWSLGDFVLSGGEIAAMALIDGISRFQPGALGDAASASEDSFSDGLLHSPQYTRPADFEGSGVPVQLLSGNHELIRVWRLKQSLGSTWLKRPDLLEQLTLTPEQAKLLAEFKQEHA
ncbi:MAG: tRNA (guanine37-N1)-methyltransferase [Pseudohongiellaceae bacterium]|jgi:tRNA (guanine37-N1)-methyltransferase